MCLYASIIYQRDFHSNVLMHSIGIPLVGRELPPELPLVVFHYLSPRRPRQLDFMMVAHSWVISANSNVAQSLTLTFVEKTIKHALPPKFPSGFVMECVRYLSLNDIEVRAL